jgi:hypothetical protein
LDTAEDLLADAARWVANFWPSAPSSRLKMMTKLIRDYAFDVPGQLTLCASIDANDDDNCGFSQKKSKAAGAAAGEIKQKSDW